MFLVRIVDKMRFFSVLIFFLCSQLYSMSDVEHLISEASALNSYFLYEDAVKLLNEAIKLDPDEKEAYKERAFSHFELNHINLALEDCKRAINPKPPYRCPKWNHSLEIHVSTFSHASPSLDFAKGLLYGTMVGGEIGTIQFASSIRGGLTFLCKEIIF